MSYTLHITRAETWGDSGSLPITVREWMEYVGGDPELSQEPDRGTFAAAWSSRRSKSRMSLDWQDGRIAGTDPDEAATRKLLRIAAYFEAHLQGDDGEVYLPDGWVRQPA